MNDENKLRERHQPSHERIQTDASLRVERKKVDDAVGATFSALEQLADAVIEKARGRADAVLAAARDREDRMSDRSDARAAGLLARNRAREDAVLRQEREHADEVVRSERSSQSSHLDALRRDTDDRLLEERSRADDALATRDEFLGIVSHDLRNMLATIMGFATLIEKVVMQPNHTNMVRLNAQRIQQSGARMTRLIGDLVDVASIEAGALAVSYEDVNPAALVAEAVDTFQTQAGAAEITLVAEVTRPVSLVRFDPARIFQVLANLLSNALKFTPRKGRVVLSVEELGDEVRFGVRDTGMGIVADKLEAIFERFHQLASTDRRSVGLGLYICKCIVQGHRGRIWAESQLGEGSIFYFTLPVRRAD
jgi:signal transduction histidine kinase